MPYTMTTDVKIKRPIVIKKSVPDSPFQKSRRIQEDYARALRGVAREVGKLIKGYQPKDVISAERLKRALTSYSELISPWALHVVNKVLVDVDRQDANAWRLHSQRMSLTLQKEILNAPTGEAFRKLMEQNVNLIKSIPLEAAKRVHELVIENLSVSARAKEIAEEILKTENITKNRATLIARTEVARAASSLTQARAQHVGSEGYIWRTSRDLTVRLSHRGMNGVFVPWNKPPELDKMTGHAGCLPNCRCYPEPVVPEG